MIFKNEAELKNFLLTKCKNALIKSQAQVYQIIDRFVKEFYVDYEPELYERTYQLYRSLVKSDIVPTVNGYEAKVYFDLGDLDYIYGANPSGEQVMGAAAIGMHGAEGLPVRGGNTGVSIWSDPKEMLDAHAIDILERMLIAEGIPVKRG